MAGNGMFSKVTEALNGIGGSGTSGLLSSQNLDDTKIPTKSVWRQTKKIENGKLDLAKGMFGTEVGVAGLDFIQTMVSGFLQNDFMEDLLGVQQDAMQRHYNLQESALATSERIAQITSKTERDLARINAGIESKKIEVAGNVKMHQIDAKLKAAALQSQFAPYNYGTPYSGSIPT